MCLLDLAYLERAEQQPGKHRSTSQCLALMRPSVLPVILACLACVVVLPADAAAEDITYAWEETHISDDEQFGGGQTPLIPNQDQGGYLSPDGSRLVFAHTDAVHSNDGLYVADRDGGGRRAVELRDLDLSDDGLQSILDEGMWGPDGATVYYKRDIYDGAGSLVRSELRRADVATGAISTVVTRTARDALCDVSPDDSAVLRVSNWDFDRELYPDGIWHLHLVPTDGGTPRDLGPVVGCGFFSPDGARIAFTCDATTTLLTGTQIKTRAVCFMDRAGGNRETYLQDATANELWVIDWNPGGSKLLLHLRDRECATNRAAWVLPTDSENRTGGLSQRGRRLGCINGLGEVPAGEPPAGPADGRCGAPPTVRAVAVVRRARDLLCRLGSNND